MTVTRTERVALWMAAHIPLPILASPERVLINFACIVLGVAALASERPDSLLALWPWWIAVEWALIMAGGGLAALVGYWLRQGADGSKWDLWLSLERVGYLAIFLASTLYGVGALVVFGWQGLSAGIVYLGIALAKLLRLTTSTSARAHLLTPRETGAAE